MKRREDDEQERKGILHALSRFRGARTIEAGPQGSATIYPTPPSRRHRRAFTSWQDVAALDAIKDISKRTGISQQALIAEGINHVLAKYGKPTVAT
jgi:hypothetical protein